MMMSWKGLFFLSLHVNHVFSSVTEAWNVTLPTEFTLKIDSQTPGVDLVWAPADTNMKIRVGDARPEFRLVGNDLGSRMSRVMGYPRIINGTLCLSVSRSFLNQLATTGFTLQVWSAGRRLDTNNDFNPSARQGIEIPNVRIRKSSSTDETKAPTIAIDPAKRGHFAIERKMYRLKGLNVSYPSLIEVLGEVTYPSSPLSEEKLPLVLFLHGRTSWCYKGNPDLSGSWPCSAGSIPVPSYQGYRYVADILASQGYLVVSISANGINGQDEETVDAGTKPRSQLIRHHLNLWAQWNEKGRDPWNGMFLNKIDMDQVVLVGHSRGGEGVHRAAVDTTSKDPYKIVGLVSYGATSFTEVMTPEVHSANILPTCDGDVIGLQGQAYVDASRDIAYSEVLRSAIIVVGANHNYFNTEWTPGLSRAPSNDDWFDESDPICGRVNGTLRLTAKEQRIVGAAYTTALVKMAIRQDASMLPLLDGSFVRPASIGRADVAVNAVGGAKYRLLYRPEINGSTLFRNGMRGNVCTASRYLLFDEVDPFDPFGNATEKVPDCGEDTTVSPHWQRISKRPIVHALELNWKGKKGATARFPLRSTMSNLTGLNWVDVRIINDPSRDGAFFRLVVLDKDGKKTTLPSNLTTIKSWPGKDFLDRYHARTMRGSLASVWPLVDLSNIVSIDLVAQGANGRVWVLDVAASQARVQRPTSAGLPRLSIKSISRIETDELQQFSLKIVADRPLTVPGTIWVEKTRFNEYSPNPKGGYLVELRPGRTLVAEIPVASTGDDLYSGTGSRFSESAFPNSTFPNSSSSSAFRIEAVNGVVTSDSVGTFTVIDDEPVPKLSITPRVATAAPGKSLKWTLNLSGATVGLALFFQAVAPDTGEELNTNDVATSWLTSIGQPKPSSPVPLSSLVLIVPIRFEYGTTSVSYSIPLSSKASIGAKTIVFKSLSGFSSFDKGGLELIGNATGKAN